MSQSITPYLHVLRRQLGTSLVASDENARKVPVYTHRLLTVLLARMQILPALQEKALSELSALLDELNAELGKIGGGLILVPQLIHHIRHRPDYAAAQDCLQTAIRLLSETSSAAGLQLQKRIARITAELQQAFHQAIVDQDLKPAAADSGEQALDATKTLALRDHLRRHFAEESTLEIGEVKRIIGGGSKVTLIVELRNTLALPNAVVVRIDMSHSITGSTVADEFNLVKLAFEAGMPVPQPYLLESGKDVLGAPFIVVSKVEGRNIGDWFEVTEPSRAFAVGLAHALAKLHNIPPERAPWLPGSTKTVRECVAQDIRYYEDIWRSSGQPSIAMEQGFAWLKRHMDAAEGRRTIVHRDVGCHNMLARDGELAALLDWETASIGTPANDLMYAHVAVVQMMPWEEFLAEYQEAGGEIPSQAEMDFYRVLNAIYGMHFCMLSRSFTETDFSDTMIVSYAGQRIYLHYDRVLHDAVRDVLDKEA